MRMSLAGILALSEDELGKAWPVFAYLFLTTAAAVASKASRDALFLDRFSAADLPYVDIAISACVGFAAALYIRASRRVPLRSLQTGSLLLFAATCLVFWWLSASNAGAAWLFGAIYVWVGVFSVLAPAQVWTLANFVLTTREAKRSFGFIGSGAILGWIVGGLATRLTAGTLGTPTLLLWVAGSLIVSAWLVRVAWQRAIPGATGVDTEMTALGVRASIAAIAGSPYLRSIAWVIGLAAFSTTLAGWQFKAIAKARIPDTDELAMFFGTFNMAAGLASLALQVLLTSRVLRTFGVGVALLIVPVAMTLAAVPVLATGSLVAVAALKASDQVLRYSIDKSTVELLYLPLSAAETFRVKSFIDTVVYRLGDAAGGLVVLACAAGLGWSPQRVGWMTLLALATWVGAAATARTRYVTALRDSIHQHRVEVERARTPILDRDATAVLAQKLRGSHAEILYALNFFESSPDSTPPPAVSELLAHEAPDVRVRAVSVLSNANVLSVQHDVERLLRDPSLEVRTEALVYLTKHSNADPLTLIEQVGDFPDFSLRASMVAFLARPGRAQNLDAALLILQQMVGEAGMAGLRSRLEAARILSLVPDHFDRELRRLLEDEAPDVAREAIHAAGVLGKRALAHRILDRLADPALCEEAAATLAGFGDRVVPLLREYLGDADTPQAIRRELPGVLQAIGSVPAHRALVDSLLDGDPLVRGNVITAINKVQQLHPTRNLDRNVVETALAAEVAGHYRSYQVLAAIGGALHPTEPVVIRLQETLSGESERIFRLLKLLYPEHDFHSAFVGIQSENASVHDNALEFLDTILAPHVRGVVVPLFDRAVSVAERAQLAERVVGVAVGSRDEAVDVMARSRDPWLQSCAAYAIGELRLARMAHLVDAWATHADPLLRTTAEAAQAKLRNQAAVSSVDVG